MARGRETEAEEERMNRMEQDENDWKSGRRGSGPKNFEKDGFHGVNRTKDPGSAPKP